MSTWKRRFRRLGIFGGGLAVLLLLLAVCYYWFISQSLTRRLAKLQEAGEPVCLEDLVRKPTPDERNGAVYLLQAEKDVEAAEKEIFLLKENSDRSYTPEELKKIHEILAAYPNIYPLLQKAAAAPDFQLPHDYRVKPSQFLANELPRIGAKRTFVGFLRNYADDLLNEGKREESLQAAMIMLQLAQQYEQDSSIMVDHLVNIACKGIALESGHKALQSGPIEEKLRADFEAELAHHDSLDFSRRAMKGERAYCLDALQKDMPPLMPTSRWQHAALDMFDDFFQFSAQPYSAWISKRNQWAARGGLNLNGPVALTLPALQAFLESAYRCQTSVRALRIINALQGKSLPEGCPIPSIAELGLPKETGIDPFNGQPLIIKRLPEGWLVYGVGQNLKDDEGVFEKNLDVGWGPENPKEEKEKQEEPSAPAE